MKTVLYLAISINGMISTLEDGTPWSDSEFEEFYRFAKEAGNIIIGRRTYEILKENGEFRKLKDVTVIVLTHHSIDGQITAKTPNEALKIVKKLRLKVALVCGGTKTNTTFLRARLIDELVIDVAPIIIGQGKGLFDDIKSNIRLKLIRRKDIPEGSTQLRYKLLK